MLILLDTVLLIDADVRGGTHDMEVGVRMVAYQLGSNDINTQYSVIKEREELSERGVIGYIFYTSYGSRFQWATRL